MKVKTRSRAWVAGVVAAAALCTSALAQPANDACTNAIVISSLPFTSGAIPVNAATNDTGFDVSCDNGNAAGARQGIWFQYTPPTNQTVDFNNIQAAFADTVTSLWTGTGCAALAQVAGACSDPEAGSFVLTGGTTYWIMVSRWSGATNYGATATINFSLSTAAPPPGNDACAAVSGSTAFDLPPAGGSVGGTLIAATNDGGSSCQGGAGRDVYYRYVAPSTTVATFSLCGSAASSDTVISVHTNSCPVSAASQIASTACDDDGCGFFAGLSSISANVTAGTTYLVRVATYDAGTTPRAFTLSVALPPANDECLAATALPATAPISVTGDTAAAGPATTVTLTGCSADDETPTWRDVFYSFTPTVGGLYNVSTCGGVSGTLDTVLSVHSGCPADDTNKLVCNDDNCTGGFGPSTIVGYSLSAGTTYLIRVGMYEDTAGGPFTLSVTSEPLGACCTSTGCTIRTQANCASPDVWMSVETCTATLCNGSCCTVATGACTSTTQAACTGVFGGVGNACDAVPCAVTQACCNAVTGACVQTGTDPCPAGTTGSGPGSSCSPSNPCPQPPPPANDACSAAQALTLGAAPVAGTNIASTPDYAAVPATWCTGSTEDVYYSVTTPGALSVKISVATAATDDFVAIIALANCGDTTNLGCTAITDDPTLVFEAPAAGTYLVRVATYTGDQTAFTVRAESVTTGACCNTTTGACTVSATGAAGCAAGSVYQNDNSTCAANICGQGACCNSTNGGCSLTTQTGCPAGSTFNSAVTTCSPTNPCPQPPPPANDQCANAATPPLNTEVGGQSITAATGADITSCSGSDVDVWYRFTAPTTGQYGVLVTPDTFDDVALALAVYENATCDPAADSNLTTTGACVAQDFAGEPSSIVWDATAGSTYLVRAGGFVGDIGGFSIAMGATGGCCDACGGCFLTLSNFCVSGTFHVGVACAAAPCTGSGAPANDACADAVTVTSFPFTANLCNDLSTADGPSGGGCNSASATTMQNSIWYRFVAPSDGTLHIGGAAETYDGVMAVFTGATCNDLSNATAAACEDDDFPYSADVAVTAGTTYYIAYGDWGTSEGGGSTVVEIGFTGSSVVCCRGSTCAVVAAADCTVVPGSQAGANTFAGSACNATGVNTTPCCKADYNKANNVELLDIFAFLNDWFAGRPYADFNGQNNVDLLDIFAFLGAWFAGPCS